MPKDGADSKKFINPLNAVRANIIKQLKAANLCYYTWLPKPDSSFLAEWDDNLDDIKVTVEGTEKSLDPDLILKIADKIMVALNSRDINPADIDPKKIKIKTSFDSKHQLIVNATYPTPIP